MSITVMDVFRFMGHVPTSEESWSVGSRVATMYRDEFRHEPPKELRTKTGGGGSHCFAVYPNNYREKIIDTIKDVVVLSKAQRSLFEEEEEA